MANRISTQLTDEDLNEVLQAFDIHHLKEKILTVTEIQMNPSGAADINAGVKMKPTELKMKPIRIGNRDARVGMNETGGEMKPLEQILFDGFCL